LFVCLFVCLFILHIGKFINECIFIVGHLERAEQMSRRRSKAIRSQQVSG